MVKNGNGNNDNNSSNNNDDDNDDDVQGTLAKVVVYINSRNSKWKNKKLFEFVGRAKRM